MRMICDRCGNDDPERIALVSEPVERGGRVIGHELVGFRCLSCGADIETETEVKDSAARRDALKALRMAA